MSQTVHISSTAQFEGLLKSSNVVVADFYADWCGPCKAIAPVYEQLSKALSRPNAITFTKINVDQQQDLAKKYGVTAMPTFMVFKDGKQTEMIRGADKAKLERVVKDLAAMSSSSASGSGSGSSGDSAWLSGELPRGMSDVTDQVDLKGLELLNSDSDFGTVRTLVERSAPTSLKNKGKEAEGKEKDWVESDTDEQLMLFMPFQAMLKVHTIQITSLPPPNPDNDDEIPMRPHTVKLYTNKPHILGFDEAEDVEATQTITLEAKDWDSNGRANIALRFVKFQNVTSLVLFVVDGDGEGEKTRIDRIRLIGETGEKRELGKLEKIGDEPGE